MKHKKNFSIWLAYITVVFILYWFLFKKVDTGLPLIFYGVFSVGMILHYLADILNFNVINYRNSDFIFSFLIAATASMTCYIFTQKFIYFKLFLTFFIIQNFLRWIFILITKEPMNVAIIGCNEKKLEIAKPLLSDEKYRYMGYFGESLPLEKTKGYLGNYDKIHKIIEKLGINKVVLIEERLEKKVMKDLLSLKLKGLKIINYHKFNEEVQGKIDVSDIDEEWLLRGYGFDILHNSIQRRVKRLFDIISTIIIFVPAFPIMVISAIVIKLESPGPVFFVQNRIGLGNKPFKMIKFRSMKLHDPDEHSKYAGENDSRITKYGDFMRKMRIDELPQLWNVIKGEMSFVGPRAEWDELCYSYMDKIPFYNMRHSVQPGLTGWAQVMYPYGAGVEDAQRKLEYDMYYIKHQNFIMDITIFFKTIKTVIFGRGR